MQSSSRIESKLDISSYLQNLRYALDNGAKISFQEERKVDENRPIKFTNKFTVADLFPNENPVDALRKELKALTVEEYIKTVKDLRYPERSEMREFGKTYNGDREVYIKIRVELFGAYGGHTTFVMSFHYAQTPFSEEMFPYGKRGKEKVHGNNQN